MRIRAFVALSPLALAGLLLVPSQARLHGQGAASQTFKGLEMRATGIARASNVALIDCPPGANTVRGNARPGEEFAVVSVAFTVTPGFKDTVVKKPVLVDASGKTFNTSVSIIDAGSVPSYTCEFPFRVPEGTKLGKLQIETATLDLTALDAVKR